MGDARRSVAPTSRRHAPLVIVVVLLLCVGTVVALVGARNRDSRSCSTSSLLVPRCGALWGVATDPNSARAVRSVEQLAQTHFDFVYRFHDLNDRFPTADEKALIAQGRILHVTISPSIFGSRRTVGWKQISGGAYDRQLSAQAKGVAALHVPVFMTFDHESDRPDRSVRGSAADFIAAWRHVHSLYARAGATNAVWVWVVTGYAPFFARAGALWPGNRYVDWIGWEAYNGSGCPSGSIRTSDYRSFGYEALKFYRWVHQRGPGYGIDSGKPMMISEAGSVVYAHRPQLTADWYAGIPHVLTRYPQIKAVTLWDRPGNGACAYKFDHVPSVLAAVGAAFVRARYSPFLSAGAGG
jgi:hypothetical protein